MFEHRRGKEPVELYMILWSTKSKIAVHDKMPWQDDLLMIYDDPPTSGNFPG